MGLPLSESDSVSLMFGIDTNEILAFEGSTPPPLVDYVSAVGNRTFHAWRGQIGWGRDTRNDYFIPVVGSTQNLSAEIALPGSTVEYFKLAYDFAKYWPLSQMLVLKTGVNLGYGDSYGKTFTRNLCYTAGTWTDTNDDDDQADTPPASSRSGWRIQLAASPSKDGAEDILDRALAKGGKYLAKAAPYTEPVQTGDITLYRARFAGFASKEAARAACDYLAKQKFSCLAIAN